jgi:hypothetical protein
MNRTTILRLMVLSLLASVLCHLAANLDSRGEPVPTSSHPDRNTARVAKTPKTRSINADLPSPVGTGMEADSRSEVVTPITQSVSDAELPALCDSLARDPSLGATVLRQRLIRRWAETDGPAAAAWTAQLRKEPTYLEAVTQVALGWASADPTAALEWAQALPESDGREVVTLNLGYETARTDPVKALEVALSFGRTRQRDDLIEHCISQWATMDFTAAVRWANGNVSDSNLRQRLLAAVAVAVAGQDGTAAATLVATALNPGAEQDRVVVAIVQRWVQNEPELAASWVAQFPDTPTREAAARNLVAFWAVQDSEAAGSGLPALPEGAVRNDGRTAD